MILLQIILLIGTARACTASGTLWYSVLVNEWKLSPGAATSLSTKSKLMCAVRATQTSWCNLFCYRDHKCLLSDVEVTQDTDEAGQGVVYACWTRSFLEVSTTKGITATPRTVSTTKKTTTDMGITTTPETVSTTKKTTTVGATTTPETVSTTKKPTTMGVTTPKTVSTTKILTIMEITTPKTTSTTIHTTTTTGKISTPTSTAKTTGTSAKPTPSTPTKATTTTPSSSP
nr:integumentary mucin C.1-like [Penaeus vannamei]